MIPRAAIARQSRLPCEPDPMTRQRLAAVSLARLIADLTTLSGSTQTASASLQLSGTGQANLAGTAILSVRVPGALNPRLIRLGQAEVRPDRQAAQARHGIFGSMITRWPTRMLSTPGPVSTISPRVS